MDTAFKLTYQSSIHVECTVTIVFFVEVQEDLYISTVY